MKGKKVLIILIGIFLLINFSYTQIKLPNLRKLPDLPDLVVKDIQVTNNCELIVTIANIGKAGIPSSYYKKIALQMYVDGKAGGGMILSLFDPKFILTKPHQEVTMNWFPTATKGRIGDRLPHKIKLIVDRDNDLFESNENNNVFIKTLSCGGGGISPRKLPDLKITSCIYQNNLYPGEDMGSAKVTIKNDGTASASNFSVEVVLSKDRNVKIEPHLYSSHFTDDVLLRGGRELIRFLGAKSTKTITIAGPNTIPADTPAGTYYLGIIVDPEKNVSESNEYNNLFAFPINILPPSKPDLLPTNIRWTTNYSKTGGREGSVTLTIKNRGNIAVRNFFVDFILSTDRKAQVKYHKYSPNFSEDVLLKGGRTNVRYIGPKSTITIGVRHLLIPSDAPAGTYYLGAIVDSGNAVAETIEDNNIKFLQIQVKNKLIKLPKKLTIVKPKSVKLNNGK